MALRVTVFDIDCRGERADCLFVNRPQSIVQAQVLCCFVLDFFQQAVAVNSHPYVPRQGRHHVQIFFSKACSSRFPAQQHDPDKSLANNQRDQQIDFARSKEILMVCKKSLRFRGCGFEAKSRSQTCQFLRMFAC